MLMRIIIHTLTWPTERYSTQTLLNYIKSFTYLFRSRFRALREIQLLLYTSAIFRLHRFDTLKACRGRRYTPHTRRCTCRAAAAHPRVSYAYP